MYKFLGLPYRFQNTLINYHLGVDPVFQSFVSNRPLFNEEIEILKSFYQNLIESMVEKKLRPFPHLEKRYQTNLNLFFKEFPNLELRKIGNDKEITIENIGKYYIYNLDINREKNKFISDYELERKEINLFCKERTKSGNEIQIKSKEEVLAEEIKKQKNASIYNQIKNSSYYSNIYCRV